MSTIEETTAILRGAVSVRTQLPTDFWGSEVPISAPCVRVQAVSRLNRRSLDQPASVSGILVISIFATSLDSLRSEASSMAHSMSDTILSGIRLQQASIEESFADGDLRADVKLGFVS